MADKQDIDFVYTTLDQIFRLSIGEMADFSAARFMGDFSLSLEEAQLAKNKFIVDQLHIKEGNRVLEMGSGWGPFLNYVKQIKGVYALGLTLSDGQYASCRKHGFEVRIRDCRTVTPEDYGTFDAIVSVGAFEHFCSLEEHKAGKQDEVYRNFFKTVSDLLPVGGRFYLQTMAFGPKMISHEALDIHADKNSDAYVMALAAKHLPGSWLPYGSEMITRNAEPYFKLINISNGRLDYIETIRRWRVMLRSFSVRKYMLYLKLLLQLIRDRTFIHMLEVFRVSPLKVGMERQLMDHFRIVFEKK
jgi:cyclopropane-fatty-acyl-phospholipid synthase